MINIIKEEITVKDSDWMKRWKEKICEVIRKPIQPFIFTVTTMVGMKGEMKMLLKSHR